MNEEKIDSITVLVESTSPAKKSFEDFSDKLRQMLASIAERLRSEFETEMDDEIQHQQAHAALIDAAARHNLAAAQAKALQIQSELIEKTGKLNELADRVSSQESVERAMANFMAALEELRAHGGDIKIVTPEPEAPEVAE